MKAKALFFFLFASFLLTSCEIEPLDKSLLSEAENEGGTTGGGNTGGGTTGAGTTNGYYLKVTKDGVVKQWSTIQGLNFTALNSFSITAADASSSMNLILFNFPDVGVYNLTFAKVSCVYTEGTTIFSSDYNDFSTSAGNITITELNKTNKTVKGTFNFIGKDNAMTSTKVFTKGEFFVQYTVQ